MKNKRRAIWIDPFQTLLFCRLALYFLTYGLAAWSVYIVEHSFAQIAQMGMQVPGLGPSTRLLVVVFVVGLGLVFLYDLCVVAHRLIGPIYRFRRLIRAITAGEEVELVQLRKDDYLKDMSDEVNQMLLALQERGAVVLKTPEQAKQQAPAVPV
jgi:hypothetical protein